MGRLIVQAAAGPKGAQAGNHNPVNVVISVTNTDGEPVKGLKKAAFKVRLNRAGSGDVEKVVMGQPLEYSEEFPAQGLPGFYMVQIGPPMNTQWLNDANIVQIAVTVKIRGVTFKGQTLISFLVRPFEFEG